MASIAQLQAGKHQPRGAFTVAELLQVDPEEITGSFASHSPNKLTIETLKKSNRGDDLHRADDEESLFKQLGI
ncbi:Antitoxin DinJ [compost metagenome]